MRNIARALSFTHKAVLAYLAAFTAPALLAFLLSDLPAKGARVMERLAPAWGALTCLWFLCAVYFCGCLVLSRGFRETLLTRISGFRERDEREEIVTAKAARSVFLVTLGCFIAAGLAGMIRLNVFSATRWESGRVPPLAKVGPYELRKGQVSKKGFVMWPSIGIPAARPPRPQYTEREAGGALYYYEGGYIFGPEVSRTFFALAVLQVLLFHLFARRLRA